MDIVLSVAMSLMIPLLFTGHPRIENWTGLSKTITISPKKYFLVESSPLKDNLMKYLDTKTDAYGLVCCYVNNGLHVFLLDILGL
jgi:hypothetical protein